MSPLICPSHILTSFWSRVAPPLIRVNVCEGEGLSVHVEEDDKEEDRDPSQGDVDFEV